MTEPSDIIDFHPRDHVRRRPFMYFGGTDSRALHQLVYEVVDEAVGEALLGKCDRTYCYLAKDTTAFQSPTTVPEFRSSWKNERV